MKFVHVAGDRMVWSCPFYNPMQVMEANGVVVNGTPVIDRGVRASGDNTDLIRFSGNSTNLLLGATQATWNLKFRTGANVTNDNVPLSRYTAAGNGSFWFDCYGAAGFLDAHLANTVGADRLHRYTGILANTNYDFTFVYNGSSVSFLAYLNGQAAAFPSVSGAFPTQLNPTYCGPVEVFGLNAVRYARTGFTLYSAYVWNYAMSAAEVADWYAQTAVSKITP